MPYASGVYITYIISPDGHVSVEGNYKNIEPDQYQLRNENGSFMLINEDGILEASLSKNENGSLVLSAANGTKITLVSSKPHLPGDSDVKEDAVKNDFIGKWIPVVLLGFTQDDLGETVAAGMSPKSIGFSGALDIHEDFINVNLLGNIFEKNPYSMVNGILVTDLGRSGSDSFIPVLIGYHTDGYLVEIMNPGEDSQLIVVYSAAD